ncbi:MAG: hypothetical protein ABI812_01560 [Betaproteobacteria bacterium]
MPLRTLPLLQAALVSLAAALIPAGALAETIGGNPGPQHNYVCPNADGKKPLDCYFDAVMHLYTMCRHVKSIEIIEFGYEKSTEGFNGAKSEYCTVKQRINITRPYQAALREATTSKQAVEGVRGLQEAFLDALDKLVWVEGETDEAYKKRVAHPYDDFKDRIDGIRKVVTVAQETSTPAPVPAPKKRAAKNKR